ncbi:MAG: ubiquinone/menaquinone biosynthesis methyltransferase [candidate division WOR-3 bacterium]|nr:ubiquinone/menaquinone biosynthesis methyltransferase [candidate division WOR-3 bacterium]
MFDKIVDKYELLNHILSFNLDRIWRKRAVKFLNGRILDVATGTGEIVEVVVNTIKYDFIVGIDISKLMLKYAIKNRKYERVFYLFADGEKLPFKNNSFDSIVVAFGIRNFKNKEIALSEFYRVLKDNGILVILEMLGPENFLSYPYRFYLRFIMPLIVSVFTKEVNAYYYLYKSIISFPRRSKFKSMIEDVGFKDVKVLDLTFGACSMFLAKKY